MTENKINVLVITVCAALLFLMIGMIGTASAALTIAANNDRLKIDFFYHGSTLTFTGVSDQGTDLIIKIAAPGGHQLLRKKGKVAGVLWMNVGELKFDHVPSLYSLHSTKKISDILSGEEQARHLIGYESLGKQTDIQPVANESDKTKWFDEFVKYKKASKLFAESEGDISLRVNAGEQHYYVSSPWPYQAAPGEYFVTVYAVKDKKVVATADTKVLVEQAGLVKSFASMAKNSAALYGVISIAAALVAGFGVGLIFRRGGGAH
ncbi:MAG TPA: TIGR02186 family protein [Dissulfurispiraceae bacterium]|nr:TIGR02186 family protein [Dissulfurispiraceae bacterium]